MCNDPLLNEFHYSFSDISYKVCNKRVDHKIHIKYHSDTDMVTDMRYTFSNNRTIIFWDFVEKKIYISPHIIVKGRSIGATTMGGSNTSLFLKDHQIPWFEPDITNFPKLLKKLRTYICFS
jgi:hypothetical protein